MTENLLETLRRLHTGATPGPWHSDALSFLAAGALLAAGARRHELIVADYDPDTGATFRFVNCCDAELAAVVRNALPEIIQALEENERMKRTLDFAREVFGPND
jgi:hypothetical protein